MSLHPAQQPRRSSPLSRDQTSEPVDVPVLMRIPEVSPRREGSAPPPPATEEPEFSSFGTEEPFDEAVVDYTFDSSLASADVPPHAMAEPAAEPSMSYSKRTTAGAKTWTEQIGSKLVLVLVFLAVAAVGIIATQSGPDFENLPELSEFADLEQTPDTEATSENQPIAATDDVYAEFDFSNTDEVATVDVNGSPASQFAAPAVVGSEDEPERVELAAAPETTPESDDSIPPSARTNESDQPLQLFAPTTDLAGPAQPRETTPDSTNAASAAPSENSKSSSAGLLQPELPKAGQREEADDKGRFATVADASPSARTISTSNARLARPVTADEPASNPAPETAAAPLATGTPNSIDWSLYDPARMAQNRAQPGTDAFPSAHGNVPNGPYGASQPSGSQQGFQNPSASSPGINAPTNFGGNYRPGNVGQPNGMQSNGMQFQPGQPPQNVPGTPQYDPRYGAQPAYGPQPNYGTAPPSGGQQPGYLPPQSLGGQQPSYGSPPGVTGQSLHYAPPQSSYLPETQNNQAAPMNGYAPPPQTIGQPQMAQPYGGQPFNR